MMRVRLYIILLFIFTGFQVKSQESGQSLIKGKVVDEATGESLAYATVALVVFPDIEKILKGIVADKEGKFELCVNKGGCMLIIRNLGYRNYSYNLSPDMPELIDLGVIKMKVQPEMLGMITVKPLVETSVDEIKYNLADDPDRETVSLHTILSKVPMIYRSPQGDLYVDSPEKKFLVVRNGKSDALFTGKLDDVLKAIPAKGFATVTVMLAPPERYGDYDYVVNIEADKNARLYGAVGTITGEEQFNSGVFKSETMILGSLDKFRFSLGGNFQNTNAPITKQSVIKQQVGEEVLFRQEQRNGISGEKWETGGNFSYDIAKQHFITWRLGYGEEYSRDRSLLNSGYEENDRTTGSYVLNFIRKKNGQQLGGGIDYQYDIGETKQVLNVAYSFKCSPDWRKDSGEEKNEAGRNLTVGRNEEKQQEQALQVHYYNPVSKELRLESGAGCVYRDYFSENQNEDTEHPGDMGGDLMKSRKYIVNAYLKLNYAKKRFSASIGVKADYLNDGEGTVIVMDDRREQLSETGFNFMPEARVALLFPKCKLSRLSLDYQLWQFRPPFKMLSAYKDISNPDFIRMGNPDLKPVKQHMVRLGSFLYGWNINAVWNYVGDQIGGYWYQDGEGRTIQTYKNHGYKSSYSVSANYSYRKKNLSLSVMARGGYSYEEMVQKEKQEDWSTGISCSGGYCFKNQLNCGLSAGYNDRFQSGYSAYQMPSWTLEAWVQKKFFGDSVEVEVRYQNLTRFKWETEQKVNAPDFYMVQKSEQNYLPLLVKVSYRIGSFKVKPTKNIRKSVVIDDILQD